MPKFTGPPITKTNINKIFESNFELPNIPVIGNIRLK